MPVDFIGLFSLLVAARARFVVVGGLALLLHGIDRLTADVDLVIDLSTVATRDVVRALTQGGYRPMAPVDPMALADSEQRRVWHNTHDMKVFSFWDTTNTRPTVDIMLAPVVSFDDLWKDADIVSISGIPVRIACVPDLIRMKVAAGRAQDLADLERLRAKLLD